MGAAHATTCVQRAPWRANEGTNGATHDAMNGRAMRLQK